MKRKIFALLLIVLTSYYTGSILNPAPQARAEEPYTCPEGSYPIGMGSCKKEPTGCPYGDSIPVDSPKCAPPPVIKKAEPKPVVAPTQASGCRE